MHDIHTTRPAEPCVLGAARSACWMLRAALALGALACLTGARAAPHFEPADAPVGQFFPEHRRLDRQCRMGTGSEPCCECQPTFGRCRFGDEDPVEGCGGMGFSCMDEDACPGKDLKWKALFNKTLQGGRERHKLCSDDILDPDPTAGWGPAPKEGRFAVVLSGGMRTFASTYHVWRTNLVEASGGKLVDFFFHVWADEGLDRNSAEARWASHLARTDPHTRFFAEEPFALHAKLLELEGAHLAGESAGAEGPSWVAEVMGTVKANQKLGRPYNFGAGYSQWRKVFLGFEAVKSYAKTHAVTYAMLVRARPDAVVLFPLDLRAVLAEFGSRPAAVRARGHFIAMPERSTQVVTDHWAMGTPEPMFDYARPPLPYTQNYGEGYVWQSLVQQCVARTLEAADEDFAATDKDLSPSVAFLKDANAKGAVPVWTPLWQRVDPKFRVDKPFAPRILNVNAASTIGAKHCLHPAGGTSKCVPLYRTAFTYVFRAHSAAWFSAGALCIARTNEAVASGDLLVKSGLATARPDALATFGSGPCIEVPALAPAVAAAKAFLATVNDTDARELVGGQRNGKGRGRGGARRQRRLRRV